MGTHHGQGLPVRWITSGGGTDYWPVFSPDGTRVLFTRTDRGRSALMVVDAAGGDPAPFLVGAPPDLTMQTRADWSLDAPHRVAFAGNGGIWLADADGASAARLNGTASMVYPAWYPGGQAMAVMHTVDGKPSTLKIGLDGGELGRLSPLGLYTGMPSVNRAHPVRLAYPGQPAAGLYVQENNSIWITDDGGVDAHLLDDAQGRQCWWSPDGALLAFMSTRSGIGAALYLATPDGSVVLRLTDPVIEGQHPKFSPDGGRIVFAGRPKPQDPTRIGILELRDDPRVACLFAGPQA